MNFGNDYPGTVIDIRHLALHHEAELGRKKVPGKV